MMTPLLSYWLILSFFAVIHSAAAGSGGGKSADLIIHTEADLVTLKAQDISQRRILEAMSKQFNFELIIAGPLEERRSLEIDSKPWEEILKKALTPASWAFVYDSSEGQPRLAKVFVFPSKHDGAVSGRPATSAGRMLEQTSPSRPATIFPGAASGQVVEPVADTPTAELLEAEDDETRALALVGLATTGGEQAITALRQALQDREPWIRETAVEALAEVGGEQAMQGLQQALRDANEDVRRAAEEALLRLQPPQQ
jgi:hypothetical protein